MRRRAGALIVALVIGTGWGALAGSGPAAAGGWAVTVIDPLPGKVEAGQAYPVTFWVLQHGTHPYEGTEPASIGPVGLTFTDSSGASVSFSGSALAEPAHYATTVTIPHDGTWRVTGVQGIFADYHVGTLTVPGSLETLGVPAAPSAEDMQRYWPGPVRPPVLPIDQARDPFVPAPAEVPEQPSGPAQAAAAPPDPNPTAAWTAPRSVRGPLLVIGAGVLVLGLSWRASARSRRAWRSRS